MRNIYLFLGCILFLNCSNPQKEQNNNDQNTEQQISSSNKITNSIAEVLSPEVRKLVDNWQEYQQLESLIGEYYNITPQKALSNAQNLAEAAQQLKDSVRVEKFQSPDVKIRLNVLYNNTLNLSELNSITNVENELLKDEISNTILAFSALNGKLNNIILKELLEKELKEFNN